MTRVDMRKGAYRLEDIVPKGETLRSYVTECPGARSTVAHEIVSDYLAMMELMSKAFAASLESSCGLTILHYRLLLRILHGPASSHANELAASLGVRPSTVSVAISKLSERALVERRDCAWDMRRVDLVVTAKGRSLVEVADEAIRRTVSEHWGFSMSPEEYEAALVSIRSTVERHTWPRYEGGVLHVETAIVDTVAISRLLTSRALLAYGLSANDFRVMLALRIIGRSSSSAEVARYLLLNSSDIASCLKNLEARGYITRRRDEENRRKRAVELTAPGIEELAGLTPVVFDALCETCHSSDELLRIHFARARNLMTWRRRQPQL